MITSILYTRVLELHEKMGHMKCWKYTVLSYLIFFCITGVGELAAISYIILRRHSLRFFVGPLRLSLYSSYASPLLMAAVAAVGWNGICKKKSKLLKTFSALMTIVISLEVSLCVWSFIEKEDLGRTAIDILTATFPSKTLNTTAEWDVIQTKLQCCGIHESADYSGNIPKSCSEITNIGKVVHPKGCIYPLVEILTDDFNLASLLLIIIAIVQLPAVFLSWCFANRINLEGIVSTRRETDSRSEHGNNYAKIDHRPLFKGKD